MDSPVQDLRRASGYLRDSRGNILNLEQFDIIHRCANAIEAAASGDPRPLAVIVAEEKAKRDEHTRGLMALAAENVGRGNA